MRNLIVGALIGAVVTCAVGVAVYALADWSLETNDDVTVRVPDVAGLTSSQARDVLDDAGLESRLGRLPTEPEGDFSLSSEPDPVLEITKQIPDAGEAVEPGAVVRIYLGEQV